MVLGWPLLCKYGQFHLKFLLSTNYAIYYEYVLYIICILSVKSFVVRRRIYGFPNNNPSPTPIRFSAIVGLPCPS